MSYNDPHAYPTPRIPFAEAVSERPARPVRIAFINIMDNAKATEDHFLDLIRSADPHAEVILCRMACAKADKDLPTPQYFKDDKHPLYLLSDDYTDWHDVIGHIDVDLAIVTGINRGRYSFAELKEQYPLFAQETPELLTAIDQNIKSGKIGHAMLTCWSAMAAAKVWSGVDKQIYGAKLYGMYDHEVTAPNHPLARGWGNAATLKIPHSRYSYIDQAELEHAIARDNGEVVLNGPDGPAIWTLHNRAITCLINHPEYGQSTLKNEYIRDRDNYRTASGDQNADIPRPAHYELGSAQTAQDFSTLKNVICPAFYRNLIDLARERRDSTCDLQPTPHLQTNAALQSFGL